MLGRRIQLICIVTAFAGCAPSATTGGFDSPNPASRLYAIEQAGATNDRAAIPKIVEQLDSDDPAVRSLAISVLQRLTGETYGYRDYDPPAVRELAIERWIQAVKNNTIPTSPGTADSNGDKSGDYAPTSLRADHG